MSPSRLDFDTILRWCIVVTAGVVAAFVLVNSTHSGIAKAPLFVLGALLIVTVVVLRAVLERQVNFPVSTIHLLVALHVPLVLASAYLSFDPVYTPDALAFALACIVFFFAGAGAFPSTLNIRFLFGCLEWITVALCIVGAAQFFFPENLPLVFYLGASHRVPSLLGNSASFSSFLIVVVPVVLARAAEPGISRAQSRFHVAVLAAAVALLVSTQTRSSIAGWFVSVAAFAAMTLRFKKIAKGLAFTLVTVAGILVVLTFVVPRFGARVTQTFNKGPQSTLARRLYFWEAGGKAFVASPLVGHGIGSFERTVFTYRSPDYWEAASEDVVPHAHNEVLEIAVEYGLCGLILSLAVIVLLMKKGISYTRSASGWDRLAAAGVVSSVIGIAVDNLANVTLREPPVALIVWLFLGLLASPALSLRPSRRFAVRLPLPNIAALIPLVVAVLITMVYGRSELHKIRSDHELSAAISQSSTDREQAKMQLQNSVREDPYNLFARSSLSRELLNDNRWQEALVATGELQRLSPSYPKSFLVKAYAQLRLHRYAESLESIDQELARRSHPEAYLIQAAAYRALGRASEERDATKALITKDIESGNLFEYRLAGQRLVELSRSPAEKADAAKLLESLNNAVKGDRDFFEGLQKQLSLNP